MKADVYQRGVILITCLLLLASMSLFAVQALSVSRLQYQIAGNVKRRSRLQQQAETDLLIAEQQLISLKQVSCIFPEHTWNYFSQQPLIWWQTKATCGRETANMASHYVIETLGQHSCVRFYRITLMTHDLSRGSRTILQTVEALPPRAKCNTASKIKLQFGRQSWRQI